MDQLSYKGTLSFHSMWLKFGTTGSTPSSGVEEKLYVWLSAISSRKAFIPSSSGKSALRTASKSVSVTTTWV